MPPSTWKTFEKQTAAALTGWWRPDLFPDVSKVKFVDLPLRRTPNSGGLRMQEMRADLMVVDKRFNDFKLSVECKFQKDWSWDAVFAGKAAKLDSWWKQCCKAAAKEGKVPVLIFKRPRQPTFIGVQSDFARAVCPKGIGAATVHKRNGVTYFRLDDFTRIASPEKCRLQWARKKNK